MLNGFFYFRIMSNKAIGIFDSGIGGLTVWKEIKALLPNENIIYFADSQNCPYGSKTHNEIITLSDKIVQFLLSNHVKIIVVACNTATAAAIDYLRTNYNVPFIGMEPAVKPAALNTKTGNIGILATESTFNGRLFKETSARFASDVKLNVQIGHGLVEIVENNLMDTLQANDLLEKYIQPMITANVDHIVLGCTHYPFLEKSIRKIIGNNKIKILNPAPAIARQTKNILTENNMLRSFNSSTEYIFYTSGNIKTISEISLIMDLPEKEIHQITL